MRPVYISPNGDAWFLARDPATGAAFVRHEANRPSGGQVTDIEIDTFLSGPINPEHETPLRLIGSFIYGRDGAKSDDQSAQSTGKEWSTAELTELGNMLVAGLSMEEIARVLGRGQGEVGDKVVEVGGCRGTDITSILRLLKLTMRAAAQKEGVVRTGSVVAHLFK
jgi:hypothetical protein